MQITLINPEESCYVAGIVIAEPKEWYPFVFVCVQASILQGAGAACLNRIVFRDARGSITR